MVACRAGRVSGCIVAFSFGQKIDLDDEPGPSNQDLAAVVLAAARRSPSPHVVVAQWEVARQLEADGQPADLVVEERSDGSYLDTQAVWDAARELFVERGVRDVVPVAHPWLHLPTTKRMVRASGFRVVAPPTATVRFDSSTGNSQWWTRTHQGLVVYSLGKRWPALRRWLPRYGSWPTG